MVNCGEKSVPLSELIPLMQETFSNGGHVEMTATGDSMRPLLFDRASVIRLSPPLRYRVGDVVLYRRDNGQYVLHRIMRISREGITMCGDHQWQLETAVRPDQILAVMSAFTRKKKWVSVRNPLYWAYWVFWCAVRPLRHAYAGIKRRLF